MKKEYRVIAMKNKTIKPGQVWLDTNGKRIQAHGGSVFYEDGVYYFYGENKEFTDGKSGTIMWGVKCYASTDLCNWEDKGLLIPPDLENPKSTLHPTAKAERPHIIYNSKTKKYVCFMKVMVPDHTQRTTILTADSFLGPYEVVREGLFPLGVSAGDFDLKVDEETGKAYYIFEQVHSQTVVAELTDDYLDLNGVYSTHFHNGYPPYVREASAHFIRNGKHYLITSGTTGYYPNPSEVAVADSWHGPYTILGNPHPLDSSNTSYHSQISSVFKVVGKKDLYIACADRWLPERMFLQYEEYASIFESVFNPNIKEKGNWSSLHNLLRNHGIDPNCGPNLSIADYVWLPLRFEGDMCYIDWKDEWSPEDYD